MPEDGYFDNLTVNGSIAIGKREGSEGTLINDCLIQTPQVHTIMLKPGGGFEPITLITNLALQPESGKVGIGTQTPGSMLDVFGTISLYGKNAFQGDDNYLRINQDNKFVGTQFDYRANFYRGLTTGSWWDVEPGVGNLLVDGNVGIGTKDPKYTLDVNGTINALVDIIIGGADCAEDFDIACAESVEPGMVMVIDNDGALRASEQAYDKRVAGVISGAGDLRPGITLGRQKERTNRLPLALTGKVYCKADAEYSSIEIGDLLTTSPTIGHAMKVSDHARSLGAIIGKALKPLKTGRGMIPILVALQ